MSWLRLDDGTADDPALLAIARNRGEADRFLGVITALKLYAARHLTDGFLPAFVVREHVRSRRLIVLFTTPGPGRAPLLHPRGAECDCFDPALWATNAGDYHVHNYLRDNPTRAEYEVKRAKEAELRDRELLAAIRRRDKDCCRYCAVPVVYADRRSSRGLVTDHVDPAVANGAANLVLACRGCNSRKGQRTPAAAGMTLLPPPDQTPTNAPTSPATSPATSETVTDQTTHAPVRDGTGRANGLTRRRVRTLTGTVLDAGDAGPNGHREPTGPAPPRTDSRHPDPYRRTAITGPDPADHAGLPPHPDHPP